MMFGLTGYALAAGGAVCLALSAALWLSVARIDTLKAENTALTLRLDGCSARTTNMSEDKESDNAIDNIPDADLGNVPDGWLLPETGSSSVQ